MAQTNLYTELGISQDLAVEDILNILEQQERVWQARVISQPESAYKKLALIDEARITFKTEQSKAVYDQALDRPEAQESNVSDTVRHENFTKWFKTAINYCENQKYDLAKVSLEKASTYYVPSEENEAYHDYSASIYQYCGDYDRALYHINHAIILNPTGWNHYSNKAEIYHFKGDNTQARKCYEEALNAAHMSSDKHGEGTVYGFLALLLFNTTRDYYGAKDCALKAINYGDPSGFGEKILSEFDKPHQSDVEEFIGYKNEPVASTDLIQSLINQIVSSGIMPEDTFGWQLVKKNYYEDISPNKDGFDDETISEWQYYLNKSGKIMCNHRREREQVKNGVYPLSDIKSGTYECSLEEIMFEMDFSAAISISNNTYDAHGTYNYYIYNELLPPRRNLTNIHASITRNSLLKGDALKKRLQSIIAFIEECNRIDTAYNAELEQEKEKIAKKFVMLRNSLQRKYNNDLKNVKALEEKRILIQNQINTMKTEMSSLGFFAGKRKKELQENIDKKERSLSQLETIESVSTHYNDSVKSLERQEQTAINQMSIKLRKKYTHPSQKSFNSDI